MKDETGLDRSYVIGVIYWHLVRALLRRQQREIYAAYFAPMRSLN
jgi:hypothetical protein